MRSRLVLACACAAALSGAWADPAPKQTFVLRRTICFGSCPAYRVAISADETIVWTGELAVQAVGERRVQAEPGTYAQVRAAFERARFWELPSVSECKGSTTDAPTIGLGAMDGERRHQIAFYLGCDPVTPEDRDRIVALAKDVDALLGTRRWIGDVPLGFVPHRKAARSQDGHPVP